MFACGTSRPVLHCAPSTIKGSTDRVMQQSFPALCGSLVFFPLYNFFEKFLIPAVPFCWAPNQPPTTVLRIHRRTKTTTKNTNLSRVFHQDSIQTLLPKSALSLPILTSHRFLCCNESFSRQAGYDVPTFRHSAFWNRY